MERLLALIHDELGGPTTSVCARSSPVTGGWPTARSAGAALPLADRVEWAIFSLLSTAGRLSEAALFERIGTMFTGHDQPDEELIRACLDRYRSMAATPERLVTSEDILRRATNTRARRTD